MKDELEDLVVTADAQKMQIEYYDEWYCGDLESTQRLGFKRAGIIARTVARSLKKPEKSLRFLDMGAGRGRMMLDFQGAGVQAFGLEKSAYALKTCYEEVKQNLYLMDITNTEILGDASFDLIYTNAINELPPEERTPFMQSIYRLLSPGGFLIFVFPEKSLHEYWLREADMRREKYTFFKNGDWVSRNDLMRMADQAGFDLWKNKTVNNILNNELENEGDFTWYTFKKPRN